ncbi:uncharacterized protein FSUBG_9393 [Fusarium subglutinans]|uniref:Uncharacterized protein n=1 Tax=Gibberella subglutinans TaxID=42677 RepID=A0A8H5PDC7_GIBSU|nr:uncharacterized protein FSUBG_9393 [Fusarium subglutinans]KAF5594627.1 hypothetical protein FSUBG_9393 [Fusarium subglutinans]
MVAPSWSWLAFSGSVESGLTSYGHGPNISIANPNSFYPDEYQLLSLLSQAVVLPPESDPFTSFERAILKIRCLLLPTTFAGIPHSDKLSWFFRQDCDVKLPSEGLDRFRLQECDQFDNIYITFTFHFSKPLDTSLQYFLVPLYVSLEPMNQFSRPHVCGLVLQNGRSQGNEEYTRVGSWKEDYRFSSQLSPSISNTIIKLGVGKKSTLRDRSLTKNERVFDSELRKYAKRHVASKVQFPMPVVKKAMQYQPDTGEVEKKAGVSGPEAIKQEANEADEDEGPFFSDKWIKCSLLPHFTTAKWGTIS